MFELSRAEYRGPKDKDKGDEGKDDTKSHIPVCLAVGKRVKYTKASKYR
jgi:hypothetical protein